ncbi:MULTISPECIES: XdhC family protein [unclassified Streptomyces]|uniref:XdhC family protein n=1 Tax=unclassified Streptomyces TaxID=2593676 RepID=UPI000B80ECEF
MARPASATRPAYVGALGSKRAHARCAPILTNAGLNQTRIGRIHGPLGLDLGARRTRQARGPGSARGRGRSTADSRPGVMRSRGTPRLT